MGQNEWIKKEMEYELVNTFVDSYHLIAGRPIVLVEASESPDFLAEINDEPCGIEVSEIRMGCEPDPWEYVEEAWRIAEKKHISYTKHDRFAMPIILVFFASQPPLYEFHEDLGKV